MKKFLVFAGNTYYPNGGAEDFLFDADTVEEIKAMFVWMRDSTNSTFLSISGFDKDYEWVQIVERDTMKIVFQDDEYEAFDRYQELAKTSSH